MQMRIHAMKWPLDFRLKQRVEFFEKRFEVREVIVKQVRILVSIVFSE
jgi:hypothetical protein